MIKKFQPYFISFLLLCSFLPAAAQDIHFSQIFETPLLRNPALAGLFSGDIRTQIVYRSQWNSVTNAYNTVSANVEYKLPVGETTDYVTIGGQVLYDKAGTVDLTSTHVLPAINYHKSLSVERSMYLSMAVMGGYVQRSIDRSKITTNSQFNGSFYDPNIANGETFAKSSYSYFDGTAGLSFNTQLGENIDNNMFIGLAYHHFNKSKKVSFYSDGNLEMTPKWVASGGVRKSTTDYSYITFEGDYTTQGATKEIIAGVLYSQKLDDPVTPKYTIHGGAYMRLNDAVIPVVKIEAKPMAIAVSYDVNISGLKKVSAGRGGFEISLIFQKFLDKYNSTSDATRCPKF
ncbi:MAG: PorP/SprF family type IX secretion system membrane protein [Ferruginibacter sp.]